MPFSGSQVRYAAARRLLANAGNAFADAIDQLRSTIQSIAYISDQSQVFSTEAYGIEPALAAATIPNAIMAQIALTRAAPIAEGESVLILGALGAFAAAFPGIARQLGASRVVGAVRAGKVAAATAGRLPYDQIVASDDLIGNLGDAKFDVIVDPVGGSPRTQSLALLAPSGRLLLVGNASGDWDHAIASNTLWHGNFTVTGFNAGGYLPAHAESIPPAAEAALQAVAAGLIQPEIDVIPLAEAATAHERLESHSVNGRIVLTP